MESGETPEVDYEHNLQLNILFKPVRGNYEFPDLGAQWSVKS